MLGVLLGWLVPLEAGILYPTDLDQYFLELVNRARANPQAEASRFGISLNEGVEAGTISPDAKQPLAFNLNLIDAAHRHSSWMLHTDTFSHTGEGGSSPGDRSEAAGYEFRAPWSWGENLAWQGQTLTAPDVYTTTTSLHRNLFVDSDVEGRGHRISMMNPAFRETGVGLLTGTFTNYNAVMVTQEFAVSAGTPFLTGVIFSDLDKNGFYSPKGEGYGHVKVIATPHGGGPVYQTKTFLSGGYSLALPPGTYDVLFSGVTLGDRSFLDVVIGNDNVKIDVVGTTLPRPWTNLVNPLDVNHDRLLSALDALVIINELNATGVRPLGEPRAPDLTAPYYDANGDNYLSALDALVVINALNNSGGVAGTLAVVPEPSSFALALLGLAGLYCLGRRYRGRKCDQ